MAASSPKKAKAVLRIAVIGAGIAGLAAGLELRRRGAEVTIYEAGVELGAGATQRAAGMLGAAFEFALEADQPALVALAGRAAQMWPEFARRVEKQGDGAIDYSGAGSIVLARDTEEADWLERLASACQARDLPAKRLTLTELKREAPNVSSDVTSALFLYGDGHVDPPLVLRRLAAAAQRAGIGVRMGRAVAGIAAELPRITEGLWSGKAEFVLPDGWRADRIVLANGLGRPHVAEIGEDRPTSHIVPVKGHVLALAPTAGAPGHVLRTRHGYVAPKARWTLAGSSMARGQADTEVDRAVVDQLRAMAVSLAPDLADAPEVTAWAGVRPGTPDDAPMIGETATPGVFALLGLYRNGVLLAPAAAELLAGMILDGKAGALSNAFDPRRFDGPRFDKRPRP